MIELLILFYLYKKVLTMYGISREIKKDFSVLTIPSIGTIKPALVRLEKKGFIKVQKAMSEGGRPSSYYSITNQGKDELERALLAEPLENPIQFLQTARIKIICADVLDNRGKTELFKVLKLKAENILIDANKMLLDSSQEFYTKMVFDNIVCEYKNFISLLEGLERASKN